ncbi:hypothetical protein L914_07301 [Phytophthora nicotianae]|uniref:Uncharacterized protein n=1 Tax=Phytophthora nicotianae TaxID=4792 RepID=W2NHV1_PHYNI|nr:hypothetical protein L914_07301 [Phytophthora nicotianae]
MGTPAFNHSSTARASILCLKFVISCFDNCASAATRNEDEERGELTDFQTEDG